MKRIIHLTTVHPRHDTRILLKQCSSLANLDNYKVSLVVSDGQENEVFNNVNIINIDHRRSRLKRMIISQFKILKFALINKAHLYHIHDPELIPTGFFLKLCGKKVIYDAHENIAKQLIGKPYLKKWQAKLIGAILSISQKILLRNFDHIITATKYIKRDYAKYNSHISTVNNYPIIGELKVENKTFKENEISYLGGITPIRGVFELIESLPLISDKIKLVLMGKVSPASYLEKLKSSNGWKQVEFLGPVNREEAKNQLATTSLGCVLFHPLPNHIEAQPNKIFEYMSAGVPIIGSNFPLWKDIIEENNCGKTTSPLDPKQIAETISHILQNPDELKKMSSNGVSKVQTVFNWSNEEKELFNIYQTVLK